MLGVATQCWDQCVWSVLQGSDLSLAKTSSMDLNAAPAECHIGTVKTRNFLKCKACRHDNKACVWREAQNICQRCFEKKRTGCVRIDGRCNANAQSTSARYMMCLWAAMLLLDKCMEQSFKLSNIIRPQAGFIWYHPGAFSGYSAVLQSSLHNLITSIEYQSWSLWMSWRAVASCQAQWACRMAYELRGNIALMSGPFPADVAGCIYASTDTDVQQEMMSLTVDERIVRYENLSFNLTRILTELFQRNVNGLDFDRAFPPGHIAYLNGDTEVAVLLWSTNPQTKDLMHRTLLHIVLEFRDIETLHKMAIRNSRGMISCPRQSEDRRFLSPLALATLVGDYQCFEKLGQILDQHGQQHATQISRNYRWMDLALAGGCEHIVACIAQPKHTGPLYARDIEKAIDLGRPILAICLVPRLRDSSGSRQAEVDKLRDLAFAAMSSLRFELWQARSDNNTDLIQHYHNILNGTEELYTKLSMCRVTQTWRTEATASIRKHR